MKNWNDTLNRALEANTEKLIELWPLGSNITYGETVQHIVEDGKNYRLISVYRNNSGCYETAVSYLTD